MAKNDSTWKENWQRLALMEDQIMKENSTFAYTNSKQIFLPIVKTFALLNFVKTKMGKFQFIRKL